MRYLRLRLVATTPARSSAAAGVLVVAQLFDQLGAVLGGDGAHSAALVLGALVQGGAANCGVPGQVAEVAHGLPDLGRGGGDVDVLGDLEGLAGGQGRGGRGEGEGGDEDGCFVVHGMLSGGEGGVGQGGAVEIYTSIRPERTAAMASSAMFCTPSFCLM